MSPTQSDDLKLSKLLRCKIDGLGNKAVRLFEPLQTRDPARLARVFRFAYHAASLSALMQRTGAALIGDAPPSLQMISFEKFQIYAKVVLRWCHNEGLHVCLSATDDLPAGASLPPIWEGDCWVGYLSCGEDAATEAILLRLLRAVGHHLAGRLLVDEDQESMADVFVTVAMGVLTALEAGQLGLNHPIVMAAQKILDEGREWS